LRREAPPPARKEGEEFCSSLRLPPPRQRKSHAPKLSLAGSTCPVASPLQAKSKKTRPKPRFSAPIYGNLFQRRLASPIKPPLSFHHEIKLRLKTRMCLIWIKYRPE
jgi:hypothetical protein